MSKGKEDISANFWKIVFCLTENDKLRRELSLDAVWACTNHQKVSDLSQLETCKSNSEIGSGRQASGSEALSREQGKYKWTETV